MSKIVVIGILVLLIGCMSFYYYEQTKPVMEITIPQEQTNYLPNGTIIKATMQNDSILLEVLK